MKQINLRKLLFFVSLFCISGVAEAQVHPLDFGPHSLSGSTTLSPSNWFLDYVGARTLVTQPSSIAGLVTCSPATIGASDWPNIVWPAAGITNVPIVMDTTCDSFGGTAWTGTPFAGKIAVIWRGPLPGGACGSTTFPFTQKAYHAQQAGAVACVIINEYPGAAPFSPGYEAGSSWGLVTIPVIMIGNLDGINISGVYHSSPAGTVKMSITPWGLGYANDLGLVSKGEAVWHDYAIPAGQLAAGSTQFPYKMLDGAFVANFGSHPATNVKLSASLSFTPTGGSASLQHTDTVTFAGPFTGIAHVPAISMLDTTSDSIMAMFPSTNSSEYNLSATTPGTYNLTYNLSSDTADQYSADNSFSTSFYVTDSLFSKGRYDFVNNKPLAGSYEAFGGNPIPETTWGDMFYVAQGGNALSQVQYSLSNSSTAHPPNFNTGATNDIYVFSWVDGSNGQPLDSLVQDGELTLVSWTTHYFVPGVDTSGGTITQTYFNDPTNDTPTITYLNANTWYYIAIDLPAPSGAPGDTLFLGIDGNLNAYPRVFGRWWDNGGQYLDYSNFANTVSGETLATTSTPAQAEPPIPFAEVSFVSVVDSFSWTSVLGLTPSIALTTTTHPTLPVNHTGVKNQAKVIDNVSLFPNPASDHVDVSINLGQMANSVTYKVIDAVGRAVSMEKHNNVLSETFSINTASMHSGNYYLLITADGMHASKKFTIIK